MIDSIGNETVRPQSEAPRVGPFPCLGARGFFPKLQIERATAVPSVPALERIRVSLFPSTCAAKRVVDSLLHALRSALLTTRLRPRLRPETQRTAAALRGRPKRSVSQPARSAALSLRGQSASAENGHLVRGTAGPSHTWVNGARCRDAKWAGENGIGATFMLQLPPAAPLLNQPRLLLALH